MIKKSHFTLKKLLITCILLNIAFLLCGGIHLLLFIENDVFFNEITLILSIGICGVLLFAVRFSNKLLFSQVAVITFVFLLFFIPRIITYAFFPQSVSWPFGNSIDASTVNGGLVYLAIGTVLFLMGMNIADISLKRPGSVSGYSLNSWPAYSRKVLLMLFLVVAGMQLYSSLVMGISSYGKMRVSHHNTLFQLARSMFEFDSVFLFVFASLFLGFTSREKWDERILIVVAVCYIVVTGVCGSRAGVLRVLTGFIICWTVVGDRLRLNFGKVVRAMFIFLLGGLLIFYVGTMARAIITNLHYKHSRYYGVTEAKKLKSLHTLVMRVSNRMGVIDYPILIVTQKGNPEAIGKYMKMTYSAKNIINMLVPGTVFPEARIMTSRVVDLVYRDATEPQLYERYFSEYWTLWGITYIYFGNYGGLFALFLAGFVLHFLYIHIVMLSSGLVQFYLKLWFLYYVSFNVIINMGIESAVTTLLFGILPFVTLFLCIYFINSFTRLVHFSVNPVGEV